MKNEKQVEHEDGREENNQSSNIRGKIKKFLKEK